MEFSFTRVGDASADDGNVPAAAAAAAAAADVVRLFVDAGLDADVLGVLAGVCLACWNTAVAFGNTAVAFGNGAHTGRILRTLFWLIAWLTCVFLCM